MRQLVDIRVTLSDTFGNVILLRVRKFQSEPF